MWSLVLVCTIYRRSSWVTGLQDGALAWKEKCFCQKLPDAQDQEAVAKAIARCTKACEVWLNNQGVTLWNQVVVTVYSLEVQDEAA